MCGRFAQHMTWSDLFELLGGRPVARVNPPPRYNVAPSTPVVTLFDHEGVRTATTMRWGVQPSWANSLLINAQAETYTEKRKTFWGPFERCVVPASGFYEWQLVDGKKQPMYIHRADGRPSLIAGLCSLWQEPEQAALQVVVLLTTRPNDLMKPIHHRMPAFVEPSALEEWMDPRADRRTLGGLLEPCPSDQLVAHRVSRRVNNVANDGPQCIEDIDD